MNLGLIKTIDDKLYCEIRSKLDEGILLHTCLRTQIFYINKMKLRTLSFILSGKLYDNEG